MQLKCYLAANAVEIDFDYKLPRSDSTVTQYL